MEEVDEDAVDDVPEELLQSMNDDDDDVDDDVVDCGGKTDNGVDVMVDIISFLW